MPASILVTKLHIPSARAKLVSRSRLLELLNAGLQHKLTLLSAPAGFGKTTLLSSWSDDLRLTTDDLQGEATSREKIVNQKSRIKNHIAWLSLDEGDNDPKRFLSYFVAALQTIAPNIGSGALTALQSPQAPSIESILTVLLNDINVIQNDFALVLDDYHLIDSRAIDKALSFLLEHQPLQMHLVIATREDPQLPLARLRARGQLSEIRAVDLRFNPSEAADFLNQVMGLSLSEDEIAALEDRTEGWIAGLQLAAISMQGLQDTAAFVASFAGSHRFIMDYLIEEVLQQQSEAVQTFLLRTSILERLCGPLCDALCPELSPQSPLLQREGEQKHTALNSKHPPLSSQKRGPGGELSSGQQTLEALERGNLFLIPLDDERRWFRYHHLFADLLRQRLQQQKGEDLEKLHKCASQWYEDNELELEAFHHATAANDIERAERLIQGKGMPLHFRGATLPVLSWLKSLPAGVLNAHPSLWVTYASALSIAGQTQEVEEKLHAAESALEGVELNDHARNLIGHIAAIRALLAATQYQIGDIISQSRRALEYLHPDNLAVRTATIWKLGIAYQLQGDRAEAGQAYSEAISVSRMSKNTIIHLSAASGLGDVQESQNQLYAAAETYQQVLQLAGEAPQPVAYRALLGLARIFYQWNDLDSAQQHGEQSVKLARQMKDNDEFIACELLLARLKCARGDADGAADLLAEMYEFAHRHNLVFIIPKIAAAQIAIFLQQGKLAEAEHLADTHEHALSQARVCLARGDSSAALALLESYRRQMEAKGWQDEQLKTLLLQALALQAHGEHDKGVGILDETLRLAEPGGFIRLFVDEGPTMAQLLSEAAKRGTRRDYVKKLQLAFDTESRQSEATRSALLASHSVQALPEPLSERELEVLQLIAQGLSNREIGERLFLALSTIKGHNQKIFEKLEVKRRTEAVARARELGLLY